MLSCSYRKETFTRVLPVGVSYLIILRVLRRGIDAFLVYAILHAFVIEAVLVVLSLYIVLIAVGHFGR